MKKGLLLDNFLCFFTSCALFFDQICVCLSLICCFLKKGSLVFNLCPLYTFLSTLDSFVSKGKLLSMKKSYRVPHKEFRKSVEFVCLSSNQKVICQNVSKIC